MAKYSKKQEETTQITWNTISGTMRVFTNEMEGAKGKTWLKSSFGISSKDPDGEYHSYYIDIRFRKCPDIDEVGTHIINVKNAFFATEYWYDKKAKEERVKPVLVILDYEDAE